MQVFLMSCIAAAVIAIGATFALNLMQENVDVAYSTVGTRV
jgi:hypothetical protein